VSDVECHPFSYLFTVTVAFSSSSLLSSLPHSRAFFFSYREANTYVACRVPFLSFFFLTIVKFLLFLRHIFLCFSLYLSQPFSGLAHHTFIRLASRIHRLFSLFLSTHLGSSFVYLFGSSLHYVERSRSLLHFSLAIRSLDSMLHERCVNALKLSQHLRKSSRRRRWWWWWLPCWWWWW
jgi:hypothetical protein